MQRYSTWTDALNHRSMLATELKMSRHAKKAKSGSATSTKEYSEVRAWERRASYASTVKARFCSNTTIQIWLIVMPSMCVPPRKRGFTITRIFPWFACWTISLPEFGETYQCKDLIPLRSAMIESCFAAVTAKETISSFLVWRRCRSWRLKFWDKFGRPLRGLRGIGRRSVLHLSTTEVLYRLDIDDL